MTIVCDNSYLQQLNLFSFCLYSLSFLTIQSWQGIVLLLCLFLRLLLLLLLLFAELGHLGNVVFAIVQWKFQLREKGGRWWWGGWRGGGRGQGESCSCCDCPSVAGEGLHGWGRGRGGRGGEVKGHQVVEKLPVSVQWASSGSGARGGGEERESWVIIQGVEGALLLLLVAILTLQDTIQYKLATRGQNNSRKHQHQQHLSICHLYFSHLVVGVWVQQGRLHMDRGLRRVENHVVHVLLHHLRVSWSLGPLNPLLTGAWQSGWPGN